MSWYKRSQSNSIESLDSAYLSAVENENMNEAFVLVQKAFNLYREKEKDRINAELEALSNREIPFVAWHGPQKVTVLGPSFRSPVYKTHPINKGRTEEEPMDWIQLLTTDEDGRQSIRLATELIDENGNRLVTRSKRMVKKVYSPENPFGKNLPLETVVRDEQGRVIPLSKRFSTN